MTKRKDLSGVRQAVAEAVAREISSLRDDRKVLAAKVDAAISRLDAAIARAEARSSDNTHQSTRVRTDYAR